MDSVTQLLTILVLLVVFTVNLIVRRRKATALRPISGFTLLPKAAAASIESRRPLHLSFGGAALGSESTPLALAASDFFYHATRASTLSDAPPILTASDTTAIPLALDTLRRAYASRGMLSSYQPVKVRWYAPGGRSLAFTAALMAMQREEQVMANFFSGSFGTEIALTLDAAQRDQRSTVVGSDQLEGQAVAYAMADHALLGDELFAASAYLGQDYSSINRSISVDVLRWLLVFAVFLLFLITALRGLGG